jgi:hypothetical protein
MSFIFSIWCIKNYLCYFIRCGVVGLDPNDTNCKLTRDLSLPYPECCEKIECVSIDPPVVIALPPVDEPTDEPPLVEDPVPDETVYEDVGEPIYMDSPVDETPVEELPVVIAPKPKRQKCFPVNKRAKRV